MRILVVQESDWLERGPHQQHHLMERFQLRGHKVRVIDFEISWKNKPRERIFSRRSVYHVNGKACKASCITVVRPSMVKVPLLDYMSIPFSHSLEVRRQIAEFKPDVIVGLGILNTYIAMRLAKKFGIPFVYYLIDALHTLIPFKTLRMFGKVLESQTLRASDMIFVINKRLRDYVTGLGADPERMVVLGAGVDTNRFNPKLSGDAVRAKYSIGRDEIVLFFMGWLYTFSGLREVAASLIKYRCQKGKLRLLVLGEGDLYEELLELKRNFLGDSLILVDWQPYDKVPEYIAASDICLLPAYNNEIMRNIVPIKMYEYMACGKPVISTRLPGIMKEFGYSNGVVYVDRPAGVLRKAIELTTDDGSVREHGARAREFVEKYSWDKITDEFEDVLKASWQ